MPRILDQVARALKILLFAFAVLFAQQAAQLHALGHAAEQLAQPHKGKARAHPIEQCCTAYHALGSALTAGAAPPAFDTRHSAHTPWFDSGAHTSAVYHLRARAPPQAV